MVHTRLFFRDQAREKVLAGATVPASALRIGPRSKSVLIGERWGTPTVCNDGVTIAKRIRLHDPDEDLGAQVLRQDAYDDAIHATQAAIAEGIVPGGGVAYLRVARAVETLAEQTEGDERTALRISPERWSRLHGRSRRTPGSILAWWSNASRTAQEATGSCRDRQLWRSDRGRDHRPDEGYAGGAAERCLRRRSPPPRRGNADGGARRRGPAKPDGPRHVARGRPPDTAHE